MRLPAPFHLPKGYFSKLTPEGEQMCSEISIHARPGGSSLRLPWKPEKRLWLQTSLWASSPRGAGPGGASSALWGTTAAWWVCEDEGPASSFRCPLRRASAKRIGKGGICPASFFLEKMRLISNIYFLCCGGIFFILSQYPLEIQPQFPWNIKSFSD